MTDRGGSESPKTLEDLSHLFFSSVDKKKREVRSAQDSIPPSEQVHVSSGPLQSNRAVSPLSVHRDSARLKKLILSNLDLLFAGGRLVDEHPGEPDGIDLILADASGNPVFIHFLETLPEIIPYRILHLLSWLEQNEILFRKAYSRDGIHRTAGPTFIFFAPSFPQVVVDAIVALGKARIRLFAMRPVRLNGRPGYLVVQEEAGGRGTGCFIEEGR